MNPEERQALREKHTPLDYGDGVQPECLGCDDGCYEGEGIDWPCDVIKVLDELDRVMNAAEVYGLIAVKHLTERDIESKILAVIHAYDETPESKMARIWQILGEKA